MFRYVRYAAAVSLFSAWILAIPIAVAAPRYEAGSGVVGDAQEPHSNLLTKRTLRLYFSVSRSQEVMTFVTETSVYPVSLEVVSNQQKRLALIDELNKISEWIKIAKTNKADIIRKTTCIGHDPNGICASSGVFAPNQISIGIVSVKNGSFAKMSWDMMDREKRYVSTTMFFDEMGIRTLVGMLQKADEALAKAKATEAKEALFK